VKRKQEPHFYELHSFNFEILKVFSFILSEWIKKIHERRKFLQDFSTFQKGKTRPRALPAFLTFLVAPRQAR
jgi:hypothetical protein